MEGWSGEGKGKGDILRYLINSKESQQYAELVLFISKQIEPWKRAHLSSMFDLRSLLLLRSGAWVLFQPRISAVTNLCIASMMSKTL